MNIGERVKQRRLELKMSVDELAERIGKDRSTVYRYESHEIEELPLSIVEPLALALKTTPAFIMGWDIEKGKRHNNKYKIPVLGTVRAGYPSEAVENILDYEEITEEMARSGEFFALRVNGDSMEPRFIDGDVVIVRKQEDIDNGDIAIMLVNGDEATLKKVQKFDGGINLIPANNVYDVITYSNKEIAELPVRCLGKVVELRAKF